MGFLKVRYEIQKFLKKIFEVSVRTFRIKWDRETLAK